MNRFAVERSDSREISWPDAPEFDRPQALVRWGDTINRVAMQRVERRIGLRLFGRWFGYESSTTERHVETVQLTKAEELVASAAPLPRGHVALAGGGVLAIALLGGAIGALLVPTTPQAANSVPLVTTLPAPTPIAVPRDMIVRHRVVTQPAALAPVASSPATVDVQVAGTITPDVVTDTDPGLTLAQAKKAALSSGEPAYWVEGSRNGVVVAGPEHDENGQLCRLVAVFTRVDGDRGSTQSATQCRAGQSKPQG